MRCATGLGQQESRHRELDHVYRRARISRRLFASIASIPRNQKDSDAVCKILGLHVVNGEFANPSTKIPLVYM